MEKRPIIEAIGDVWDAARTSGKIALVIGLVMIVGVGYWIGTKHTSYRLDALEAKYERQLTELRSESSDFIYEFSADDWELAEGDGRQLRIPYAKHKVNTPVAAVQRREENGNWQDVSCEIEVDELNTVIVTIATRGFDGRVVLK